jgi:hypothetical protein
MIAIERSRIDNVYIDGVQIVEISIPEKTNLFQRRLKRNIRIQEYENQEEVEQEAISETQNIQQQGMNLAQDTMVINEDDENQELSNE